MTKTNKTNKRNPQVYRVASEYAQMVLGYENADMCAAKADNAVRAIAKENGWTAEERETVWNTELRFALKFWDVSTETLMACNH